MAAVRSFEILLNLAPFSAQYYVFNVVFILMFAYKECHMTSSDEAVEYSFKNFQLKEFKYCHVSYLQTLLFTVNTRTRFLSLH
jgi:hypothetical protein